jgi:hypothetical protein
MRGDDGLLAAAKAVETLFAGSSETARPLANLETLAPSAVDLRSIVTHAPDVTNKSDANAHSLRTAV